MSNYKAVANALRYVADLLTNGEVGHKDLCFCASEVAAHGRLLADYAKQATQDEITRWQRQTELAEKVVTGAGREVSFCRSLLADLAENVPA